MFFIAKKTLFILFKVLFFLLYLCFPWHSSNILGGTQALKYRIRFQKISVKISSPCLTLKSTGIKIYASVPVQNFHVLNISNPFSLLSYTELQWSNSWSPSIHTHWGRIITNHSCRLSLLKQLLVTPALFRK